MNAGLAAIVAEMRAIALTPKGVSGAAVREFADRLEALHSQAHEREGFPWELFPCYLIDNCEGGVISEESIQQWASDMLKNPRYTAAAPTGGSET